MSTLRTMAGASDPHSCVGARGMVYGTNVAHFLRRLQMWSGNCTCCRAPRSVVYGRSRSNLRVLRTPHASNERDARFSFAPREGQVGMPLVNVALSDPQQIKPKGQKKTKNKKKKKTNFSSLGDDGIAAETLTREQK